MQLKGGKTVRKDLNYVRLGLVLVFFLTLLVGGQWAFRQQYIEDPLGEQICRLDNVAAVSFMKSSGHHVVQVELNGFGNIYREYQEVEATLQGKDYEIVFLDQPNEKLKSLEESLQPAIYQALAQNEYLWLQQYLIDQAQAYDCEALYYLDNERLYLQLSDEKDYIYRMISRA